MTGHILLNCWLFKELDNVHYCVMVLMFVMCVLVLETHYRQVYYTRQMSYNGAEVFWVRFD